MIAREGDYVAYNLRCERGQWGRRIGKVTFVYGSKVYAVGTEDGKMRMKVGWRPIDMEEAAKVMIEAAERKYGKKKQQRRRKHRRVDEEKPMRHVVQATPQEEREGFVDLKAVDRFTPIGTDVLMVTHRGLKRTTTRSAVGPRLGGDLMVELTGVPGFVRAYRVFVVEDVES